MARMRLGEILVQAGVLPESGLRAALQEQRRWGGPLGRILVDMGLVQEDLMVQALSRQLNLPMVRIEEQKIAPDVLDLVTAELASQHAIMPFKREGKFLDVAMGDPTNLGIIDELRIRTQLNVRPYLAGPRSLQKVLARYYGKVSIDIMGYVSDPGVGGGIDEPFDANIGAGGAKIGSASNVDVVSFDGGSAKRIAPQADRKTTPENYPSTGVTIRYGKPASRDEEIAALQNRLARLEALVSRDEDVLRKVLGLLVEKGVASRDEMLERIK